MLHPLAEQGEFWRRIVPAAGGGRAFFGLSFSNGLGVEIPFVHDEYAGFSLFDDEVGDFFILHGDAILGVENVEDNVSAGDGVFAALYAKKFDGVADATSLANSGSVNEEVAFLLAIGLDGERHVDAVASSAGNGADDDSLAFVEGVDDGGFADVGSSYDGEFPRFGLGSGLGFCLRMENAGGFQGFVDSAAKFRKSSSVDRRNWKDCFKTQPAEFAGGQGAVWIVGFVGRNDDGLARTSQSPGHFGVQGENAVSDADDEDEDGCRFNSDFSLVHGCVGNSVLSVFSIQEADAAGVHEDERFSAPIHHCAEAVSCDSRTVVDDGDALSDHSVEQGGFADVRPPHNCDDAIHEGHFGGKGGFPEEKSAPGQGQNALAKAWAFVPSCESVIGRFAEDESEGILKRFGFAFGLVLLCYVLIYGCDRHLRFKNGPWELHFSRESDGTPRLVINQAALGITNVTLRLEGEIVRLDPTLVRFEDSEAVKIPYGKFEGSEAVKIPYGKVLGFYRSYLPGMIRLDLFGHEVEIRQRALILNFNEREWQSGEVISLKPEQKWRAVAARQKEEERP